MEIHDILREDLWDNSRIQIHAGKTQIWNRGGHIPTNHDTLLRAAQVEDQRRRFGLAALKLLQKSEGSKFWGLLWELPLMSGHGFSPLLNTIGCFLPHPGHSRFAVCVVSSSVPPLGPRVRRSFCHTARHPGVGMSGHAPQSSWELASLPMHMGGLGLRSAARGTLGELG